MSAEVEKAMLGAILLEGSRIYEAMALLQPQDFSLSSHRQIYSTLAAMANEGAAIDSFTTMARLQADGALSSCGGAAYLASLTDGIPQQIRAYAKLIVESARQSRFASLCELGTNMAAQGEPLQDCIGRLESGLLSIRADEHKPEAAAVKTFTIEVLNRLIALKDSPGDLIGMTTGVPELDDSTTGIRDGELWIVGALPGRGKTAFGLQIAAANAKRGIPVAFFSMEMSRDELLLRLLAAESQVSAAKVRNPRWLNDSQVQYLTSAAGDVIEWPLYVDDASSLTAEELMARSKLYIRRHGVKLIVVDYLRLIEASGRELRERVANAANCLREVAKNEKVALVALSQLRRPQNLNDRPTMIDLKESGDVEAHAHCVLLLYQPLENGEFTHEDEIIIGKQRNGPLGTVKTVFDTKSLRFLPRERDYGNRD